MEYYLDNGILSVRVSSLGGELQSVKKDGKEYLWQGDPAYWDSKAPNLFPYIARLTKETCTVHGKAYRMPIHGFLPAAELAEETREKGSGKAGRADCRTDRQDAGRGNCRATRLAYSPAYCKTNGLAHCKAHSLAHSLVLRLDADERTLACYPFVFTLRILYELKEDTLQITYEVKNGGEEEMYFGIGGHPGFQVPLEDGLSFEDYFLEFEPERDDAGNEETETPVRVGFSAACFLNGEDRPYPLQDGRRIPLRHDLFDDDAIVLSGTPKCVVLRSEKGSRGVRVRFPQMPYIGFWHAVKKPAPYVCIEPWSSLPSRQDVVEELSEQPGLIHLKGGEVYRNTWSIQVLG